MEKKEQAEFLEQVRKASKEASKEGMKEFLLSMGFDTQNPIEMQKDLAHLRDSRTAREQTAKMAKRSVITLVVGGAVTIFLLGVADYVKTLKG